MKIDSSELKEWLANKDKEINMKLEDVYKLKAQEAGSEDSSWCVWTLDTITRFVDRMIEEVCKHIESMEMEDKD